jgi:hypothetical protein
MLKGFEKDKLSDKIENVKQQKVEIQTILDSRVKPQKNHTLFEVDLKQKTIEVAEFLPPKTLITWNEACEMYFKKVIKKIDINNSQNITKATLIKKENCVYVSSLNRENVIKILSRDFNIEMD